MIGETARLVPSLQISHYDPYNDSLGAPPTSPFSINGGFSNKFHGNVGSGDYSHSVDSSAVGHRFLSKDFNPTDLDYLSDEFDMPVDTFSTDHFRMFEFKVRKCSRGRSHDWTECPYAHPGEKARRRDPRKHHYSGTPCPEFRKGNCKKGDSCEFAHGVFECWLHPARYRTQLCKDGTNCCRRVCFFAHTPEQLRVLTQGSDESMDGSPCKTNSSFVSSPTAVLDSSLISSLPDSPPLSPENIQYGGGPFTAVSELVTSMRNIQLDNIPATRVSRIGSVIGSPRSPNMRPGFFSLPATPTRPKTNFWDQSYEEDPAMERVESGRDLRARMYAKLSKENSLGRNDTGLSAPDFGWVSELVK